jgi:diguanylate cyclase (GGDEF)-like protein
MAVLFLDLDGFKLVNDTLGRDIGDELLMAVAQRLKVQVRESDTVARVGGDEFVVLLDNPADLQEVERVATRLVAEVNAPTELRGHAVQVGVSIGIAVHPTDGTSSTELLKSADMAMYAAKDAGKNSVRFFQPAMRHQPLGLQTSQRSAPVTL